MSQFNEGTVGVVTLPHLDAESTEYRNDAARADVNHRMLGHTGSLLASGAYGVEHIAHNLDGGASWDLPEGVLYVHTGNSTSRHAELYCCGLAVGKLYADDGVLILSEGGGTMSVHNPEPPTHNIYVYVERFYA